MNVLFLSISMGAGHIRAAQALECYIKTKEKNSRTLLIDTFKYVSPLAHKIIVDGYLNTVRKNPSLYGSLYSLSENNSYINKLSKAVSWILCKKVGLLIDEFKPTHIVCTHPFPLQMISCLKSKNRVKAPVIAILTDFVNHPLWFHHNVDAFIVGHEYIKKDMTRCGIPSSKIYPFGIPVSNNFLTKNSRKTVLKNLQLEDKFTVLIMGGSLGLGHMENVLKSLLHCSRDMQIIVITGSNKNLYIKLKNFLPDSQKKIKLLPFTDNVSEIMDISDIIITKPGGMTVSEAFIKELPIVINSPIPGQEERNADFLVNCGSAARLRRKDNVENILNQILDTPERLEHMKKMSGKLAKPKSSQEIYNLMQNLINS